MRVLERRRKLTRLELNTIVVEKSGNEKVVFWTLVTFDDAGLNVGEKNVFFFHFSLSLSLFQQWNELKE